MNKWQKHYIDILYGGKNPRSKVGKEEFELLGNVRNTVTVHFPDFDSPVKSQCSPAHTETYTVTFDECNMPAGLISVRVLAGNLHLWTSRGYKIDYKRPSGEDRHFLPGIVSDRDCIMRFHLQCEESADGSYREQLDVDYLTRDLILKAKAGDPSLGDRFYQTLFDAEGYSYANSTKGGQFAKLINMWSEGRYMSRSELVAWAENSSGM